MSDSYEKAGLGPEIRSGAISGAEAARKVRDPGAPRPPTKVQQLEMQVEAQALVIDSLQREGLGIEMQQFSKQHQGRGPVGKAAVVGAKDRETNQVTAMPVAFTDKATLQGFVHRHTAADTIVYTDDALVYVGLRRPHATVKHSAEGIR